MKAINQVGCGNRSAASVVTMLVQTANVIFLICLLSLGARAQTVYTWDGGGTDNNWMTAANWNPDGTPTTGSSSAFTFSGVTRTAAVNNFVDTSYCAGITLNNDNSTGKTAAFTLSGNRIYMSSTYGPFVRTTTPISGTLTDTISLTLEPAGGTLTFTIGASSDTVYHNLNFTGSIRGGRPVAKAGAGTLTLSGLNRYSGKTTVSVGTLSFNSILNVSGGYSALGAPATVANGTIDLAGATVFKYTGTGHSSDRVINLTGNNVTIRNDGSGVLTLTGGIIAGGARNLIVRGGGDVTINGAIVSQTRDLTFLDGGTLTLSNAGNTFTGYLIVASGIVDINSIANRSTASAAGQGSLIKLGTPGGGIGNLRFSGVGGGSSDKDIQVDGNSATAGGRLESSVAGQTLTLSGAVSQGGTQSRLYLQGAGEGVLSGVVSGRLHIEKAGGGTWTLSNAENTYTGNTWVSEGRLVVDAAGAVSNSPLISVAAGATCDVSSVAGFTVGAAQTLAGNGTMVGDVILRGTLAAGGTNAVGTLWATNFIFAANSVVEVDCVDGEADILQLSGGVTAEANVTINLNLTGELNKSIKLVQAPLGITNLGNLATWSVTGAWSNTRVVWDAATQSVIIDTPIGTIISIF